MESWSLKAPDGPRYEEEGPVDAGKTTLDIILPILGWGAAAVALVTFFEVTFGNKG